MSARSAVPASSSKPAAAQHTPTPWRYIDRGFVVVPATGQCITRCPTVLGAKFRDPNGLFIVRAVNAHDDLLAACRCALERISDGVMEQCREDGQPTKAAKWASDDTIAHLRAAIAKAVRS